MTEPVASDVRRSRRQVPDGYVSGPDAATEATAQALGRVGDARTVLLVEGVSDQIAVETLARATGADLAGSGSVVVPAGGAHGMAQFAERFTSEGRSVVLLVDVGEEPVVRRGLTRRGLDVPVVVCDRDLEDELMRAVTPEEMERLVERNGQLDAFRTLQRQSAWDGRPLADQLRRFISSGATRKSQYARDLVLLAVDLDVVPTPLTRLLRAGT